jgi:FlaA1/EpsC-like NDP-sugar epimerase
LRAVFAQFRPDTVFHAAAYKHVPLVQSNPAEGVLNNILGTLNAARAAMEAGVASFVLISTDKAVRPTNVMGATKRVAELCLQAFGSSASVDFSALDKGADSPPVAQRTNFSMVRFGNVLGSSGSVVPLFRQQLKQGGPLTVTHAEVTRYFMTIPEAAQLVLQAGTMAQGGEVFVLDMGQPVKIIDLARRMVELSGLQVKDATHPHGDIAIEVVGLRQGEKLYEELLIGDNPEPTAHPRIMMAREGFLPWAQLQPAISAIRLAAQQQQVDAIHAVLQQLVSGYTRPDAGQEPDAAQPTGQ